MVFINSMGADRFAHDGESCARLNRELRSRGAWLLVRVWPPRWDCSKLIQIHGCTAHLRSTDSAPTKRRRSSRSAAKPKAGRTG